MSSYTPFLLLLSALLVFSRHRSASAAGGGRWQLFQRSIGISAMHMQLLNDDTVVIFDRTDFGPSNLSLPDRHCRSDQNDLALTTDCSAHSAAYDSVSNTFRPLTLLTDTWCSSGAALSDGRLFQSGGFNDGERNIRFFQPGCASCDWVEESNRLLIRRWYATDTILPDGRVIIIGGRQNFNFEFFPKAAGYDGVYEFPFLEETNDPLQENNLYPFVFVNVDGNLFIFANNRAILFDYNKNTVLRRYPSIPGGDPRCYPSTGSAVLLPIKDLENPNVETEVLVCGGAPTGSFLNALNNSQFLPALDTCARMKITDPNPTWTLETMPMARVMSDMLLLPTGDVLIVNGAGFGSAGWDLGRGPILAPVIYRPDGVPNQRFEVQNPSMIPRMYHSSAVLLRDGRVLVGGSNPHRYYNFTNVLFPTQLSLSAFSPPYLDPDLFGFRPSILYEPASSNKYGSTLKIKFSIAGQPINPLLIKVLMFRPPFSTHSFSMNQRLLELTLATPVLPAGLGFGYCHGQNAQKCKPCPARVLYVVCGASKCPQYRIVGSDSVTQLVYLYVTTISFFVCFPSSSG